MLKFSEVSSSLLTCLGVLLLRSSVLGRWEMVWLALVPGVCESQKLTYSSCRGTEAGWPVPSESDW